MFDLIHSLLLVFVPFSLVASSPILVTVPLFVLLSVPDFHPSSLSSVDITVFPLSSVL